MADPQWGQAVRPDGQGGPPAGLPGAAPAGAARRTCPFCGAPAAALICAACQRDTTAARRPCPKCGRMTPSREPSCWNCGAIVRSEMWWKIPLIVALFVLAFALAVAVNVFS